MIENLYEGQVLSVTQANQLAKELLESVPIWVEGEAFDVRQKDRRYRYNYFYLKDPETEYQLPCIAEPYYVDSLSFSFEEGNKYKMFGTLTLWEKGGKYQFNVRKIEPVGVGNLLKDLEELKQRLQKDGLFDESAKKTIPEYPEKIGVVTSLASGSAAWDDFRRHSIEVFPFLQMIVRDSYVQGDKAIPDVVAAIGELDKMDLDVIIVTRGGGAMEDLMAFNSEAIARAIFAAKTPIISAIGHEKDFTIADLVADARASTPTNAAHLITQNYHTFFERIDNIIFDIKRNLTDTIDAYYQQLDISYEKFDRTRERISNIPEDLIHRRAQLLMRAGNIISRYQQQVESMAIQLKLISPESTLERGYSIVTDENGKLVRSVDSVTIDQVLELRFAKGKITSKVLNKHE